LEDGLALLLQVLKKEKVVSKTAVNFKPGIVKRLPACE
jgi:hypothetical protein